MPESSAGQAPKRPPTEHISVAKNNLGLLDNDLWCSDFQQFGIDGLMGSVASHCEVASCVDGCINLRLDKNNAALYDDAMVVRLRESLSVWAGEKLQVTVEIAEIKHETPAQFRQRQLQERLAQATQALHDDPGLQLLVQEFDATLLEHTIELKH